MAAQLALLQNKKIKRRVISEDELTRLMAEEQKEKEKLEKEQKAEQNENAEPGEGQALREEQERNSQARKTKIKALKKSLKINDTIAALLSMAGLFFAILEYENYYAIKNGDSSTHFTSTSYGYVLRSFVSLSTLVLLVFLFTHSKLSYSIHAEKNHLTYRTTYKQSKYYKFFIIEAVINCIHNAPGIDFSFKMTQLNVPYKFSLNTILVTWMLVRAYLVFRLFALYSRWTNEDAERHCIAEGCEANTMLALKAVLKERPYFTIGVITFASCCIFGLAVRNFERPYYFDLEDPGNSGNKAEQSFQDYSDIWNGVWLVAVTMTTVGYGDYYPVTHLGRFVAIFACFWGSFLVSTMVVTLTISSQFEEKEAKAYNILFRLSVKGEMKDKAAKVGKLMLELIALQKQLKNSQLQGQHANNPQRKITDDMTVKKNINLRNQLTVKLQEFKNARALLEDHDISEEEHLRQLTEKVDRDSKDVEDILVTIAGLDKQITELEKSQQVAIGAINNAMLFTHGMQNQLVRYRQSLG